MYLMSFISTANHKISFHSQKSLSLSLSISLFQTSKKTPHLKLSHTTATSTLGKRLACFSLPACNESRRGEATAGYRIPIAKRRPRRFIIPVTRLSLRGLCVRSVTRSLYTRAKKRKTRCKCARSLPRAYFFSLYFTPRGAHARVYICVHREETGADFL